MKLKGINTFERHVEKFVLVAVSVIFLVVLAMQFLLQPNLVKVGNGPAVPPQLAFEQVERKAKELEAKMRQSPDLPDFALPDPAQQFAASLEAPVAPRERLVALGRPLPVQGAGLISEIGEGTRIANVNVPAPTGAVAASYWLTLDPAEVVANPELKPFVPAEQPFDTPVASVQATFNGAALRESLMADPDGEDGPLSAMPPNWWRGAVEILAVRLERQERGPTGEWSNLTEVPPLPGRPNLLAQVAQGLDGLAGAAQVLGAARAQGDQVARPAIYRTIAGTPWTPPAQAAAVRGPVASTPEIEQRLRRREMYERRAQNLREAIERESGTTGESGRRDAETSRSGGGKGGMAQPSGGRDREPKTDSKTATLEANLRTVEEQIAKVDEELAQLGYVAPTEVSSGSSAATTTAATTAATSMLETPDLVVWGHDLTAKPGKSYRYRLQVVINNPIFGRAASLPPEQQSLAAEPVLLSAHSEWSAPVEVLADSYFFVTGATEADQFGTARATAELYRYYYGYYRKGTASLEPGDPVAAAVKLPDPTMLPIYDLSTLGTPTDPAARPEEPVERVEGGRGRFVAPVETERPRSGQTQTPATQTLAENAKPGPSSLTASAGAFLLDVTRAPVAVESSLAGGSRQPLQVLLRGADGRITVRGPEEARSAIYQRVAQSAQQGETQGQPAAPQEPVQPTRQQQQQPQRPGREFESGGGGGG